MDNIGFWNVSDSNSPHKHGHIRWLLHQYYICLFGLLETRVKASNFNKVYPKVSGNWFIITNCQVHRGGRIWFILLPTIQCKCDKR